MMIKITEKCSMGCTHCMNCATPEGQHMDFDTFMKAIAFQKRYGGSFCLITGGEPTEHPAFAFFLGYAVKALPYCFITVATNGLWLMENCDIVQSICKHHGDRILFQVTNDPRYYPIPLDTTHPVFQLDNVMLCNEVPQIYPQGRALENNLPWTAKACKCFNIRAIPQQIQVKALEIIISMMALKGKYCTPHISIDGHIKLGESDLCPNCSHIDKTGDEIVQDILNFTCSGCNHVTCNLSKELRNLIGEE